MEYLGNKDKFVADYEATKNAAIAFYKSEQSDTDAQFAWDLYCNTYKSSLSFQLFGRWVLDEHGRIKKLIGKVPPDSSGQLPRKMVGIDPSVFEAMGVASNTSSGSAFKIDQAKWNITVNDTWVLGGVQSLQEFYPASSLGREYIFETHPDSLKYVVTCVGRELIGLALAGYQETKSPHPAFPNYYAPNPENAKTAEKLSLVDYQDAMSTIKEQKDAEAFLRGAGFTVPTS